MTMSNINLGNLQAYRGLVDKDLISAVLSVTEKQGRSAKPVAKLQHVVCGRVFRDIIFKKGVGGSRSR